MRYKLIKVARHDWRVARYTPNSGWRVTALQFRSRGEARHHCRIATEFLKGVNR